MPGRESDARPFRVVGRRSVTDAHAVLPTDPEAAVNASGPAQAEVLREVSEQSGFGVPDWDDDQESATTCTTWSNSGRENRR
ncbi:hypothetical protein [Kitasatospora sp. KL5]|uniref:hypothetical protein n=1 Tax=Kitasatospora sp. KL5 TaxID=3425125 RepID=UPI003D6EC0C4